MTAPPPRLPALLSLALALSSCQSLHPPGATREEKTAALATHLAAWENPVLVNQFGQPRTIQIFNKVLLDPARNRIDASSTGQASFLTPDGYALTAAHVLDDGPASFLQLKSPRPGHLALTSAGPVFLSTRRPDLPQRVTADLLEARPVRLVHRFPGLDLALVKLPLQPSQTFHLSSIPPPAGTVLFSYGSNLSGNSSAGRVLRVTESPLRPAWTLLTSIPLDRGDSGGPVMDAQGTLVGIISRGRTDLLSQRITATISHGISPATLRKLIDADRLNP